MFVHLVELWLLWMQPWTARRLLMPTTLLSGGGHGGGSGGGGGGSYAMRGVDLDAWQGWVLAAEDVYALPLVPFLSAMAAGAFESGRRDPQLCAIERVLRCFTAGGGAVMRTLLSAKAGTARRVLTMPEQLRQLTLVGYDETAARTAVERAWNSTPSSESASSLSPSAAFSAHLSSLRSGAAKKEQQEEASPSLDSVAAPAPDSSSSPSPSPERRANDVAARNLDRAVAELQAREEAEDLGLGQMMNDGQSLTPVGSTSMSNSTGSMGFTGFVGSAGQSLARDDARAAAAWRDEVPEWRTRGGEVCDALREIHYAVVYGSWLPQNVDYGDVTNRILWVVGYVVAAFVCVCARA